jgi:hypothetical protein
MSSILTCRSNGVFEVCWRRKSKTSFLSLLNLRILSPAAAAYVAERMVRAGATRALSPGYLAFIPPPPAPPVDESVPVVANFNPTPGTPMAARRPSPST